MSKLRKGATVVLKLDDLFIWMRKKIQEDEKQQRLQKKRSNNKNSDKKIDHFNSNNSPRRGRSLQRTTKKSIKNKNNRVIEPFNIVNRPFDYKKLPPCRAKIIYMGHPKFMKRKRLIFGLQLYPPYFGQSTPVIKNIFSKKVLGSIPNKDMKAPSGSLWFCTEDEIKGVMLASDIGSTRNSVKNRRNRKSMDLNNESSNSLIPLKQIFSKTPLPNSKLNEIKKNNVNPFEEAYKGFNNPNNKYGTLNSHKRGKSSFSLGSHYRNMSSIANMKNISALLWEDSNLPNSYDYNPIKSSNSFNERAHKRFKIDEWLKPIFLDPTDERSVEIVSDRACFELSEMLRREKTAIYEDEDDMALQEFYEYMITYTENYDQLHMEIITNDNYNEIEEHKRSGSIDDDDEKFKKGSLERKLETLSRIKKLVNHCTDLDKASFALQVLEVYDGDVFKASPVCQKILPYLSNDIKFMIALRNSGEPKEMQEKILEQIDRFNQYYSTMPSMWKLINLLNGDEEMVGNVLLLTNNGKETDPQIFALGILEGVDSNLDLAIPIYDTLIHSNNYNENSKTNDEYIFSHIYDVLKLCKISRDKTIISSTMVKIAMQHPLISPSELFALWKQNRRKPIISKMNLLSNRQCIYEQHQLFLGRYLYFIPIKKNTKIINRNSITSNSMSNINATTNSSNNIIDNNNNINHNNNEEVKSDKSEAGDIPLNPNLNKSNGITVIDNSRINTDILVKKKEEKLLIEITLDLDDINERTHTYDKVVTFKKCRAQLNNDNEYEPTFYYDKSLKKTWDITDYSKKSLKFDIHKWKWIPNLEVNDPLIKKLNLASMTDDNYLRGYLIYNGGKKGWRKMQSLFQELTNNINQDKSFNNLLKDIENRPVFICVDKWNLFDVNQ